MTDRRTLRQMSAALLTGEEPPAGIDCAEQLAARDRGRKALAEARDRLRRIEKETSHG